MAKARKPYNPARDPAPIPADVRGQLGFPNQHRAAKSNGFDADILVDGPIPVVRAREKAILTPPNVRREMIAEAIADLRLRGIFELNEHSISIKETAADRLLNPVEHEAICWFIRVHAKVEAGRVKIASYGGNIPKGEDGFEKPIVDQDKAMHAELKKVLPEPHLAFLEWLSWHEHPGSRSGVPPSKIEIGKQIIDSKDSRRAEGGIEGFLRAVAQNISHWQGEIETVWRRKAMLQSEYYRNRNNVRV